MGGKFWDPVAEFAASIAQEIRQLADSCAETAGHIQEVSGGVVTGAVEYLSGSARELSDHLGKAVFTQLERSDQAGRRPRSSRQPVKTSKSRLKPMF